MKPLALLLCGCALAASASATTVQTFPPARATRVTHDEAPLRAVAVVRAATPAKNSVVAASGATAKKEFTYRDAHGRNLEAPIIDRYQKDRIVNPIGKVDSRINPKLARAATIAQERAHAHSKSRCWHYVKNALLASGAVDSYPKTAYAKQAGEELMRVYDFKKLPIRDPYKAPVGAVLVYGSRRGAGHVEIRTKTGFVSDFQNKKPSPRPLIGVYAKK
ncbi:MAG: hypothetical protein ACR2NX_00955 [Chthoniobacterales bacterium]